MTTAMTIAISIIMSIAMTIINKYLITPQEYQAIGLYLDNNPIILAALRTLLAIAEDSKELDLLEESLALEQENTEVPKPPNTIMRRSSSDGLLNYTFSSLSKQSSEVEIIPSTVVEEIVESTSSTVIEEMTESTSSTVIEEIIESTSSTVEEIIESRPTVMGTHDNKTVNVVGCNATPVQPSTSQEVAVQNRLYSAVLVGNKVSKGAKPCANHKSKVVSVNFADLVSAKAFPPLHEFPEISRETARKACRRYCTKLTRLVTTKSLGSKRL
ncbi:hypothetical protein BATDEDRAFT_27033 [Batrachochytrium dendrobatidis JAM81]|uniref:Uncharacterized protein n=1 Tax=Batrachochytrium dendrobatidis (strain JAM81 / FGSC 10211) TaxID=684364 RepID=F4P9F6_BATDJ|nr:uncharacterized protein BATDEDRAFT_27033 [Batrachochytrium dendrobatidis JAM81]EGF78393.1 hypothetical protein BATDEDRAFT_27033 [Batrachochytrium dendrobatidis JAM81]|eukprot:XP_006681120.1 hypothetical protein BATDEDRAFT_27033 [Batrachochytrium dendrobatidis JAM81]